MSYPVSLRSMVTRAQQRANLEGAAKFISPAEWADMINQSIAEWYDLVRLTTFGGQYYRAATTFTTVAGQQQYVKPANCVAILSLDWFVSGSTMVVNIQPFQEEHRNIFRFWPIGWLYNQPIFYQQWGPNIAFIPIPDQVFTVGINYVPTAPKLGDPTQTLDSIDGWEEWIVCDVAIKALIKDGQADIIPAIQAQQQRQESRIRSAAAQANQHAAEVIHDVTSSFDDYFVG